MTTQGTGPAGEGGARLSPQQRYAWALYQRGAPSWARALVRVDGPLDPGRLAFALKLVVERHEILRTTFRRDARLTYPLQVVSDNAALALSTVDLSNHAEADRQGHVETLWREAAKRALDPSQGPALNVTHVRHSAGHHHLLFCLPTLCADLSSLNLLVHEMVHAYKFGEIGEEPVQYAQFAEWQYDLLGSAERPRVAPPAPFVLPFEGGADDAGASREAFEFTLDGALTNHVYGLSRRYGGDLASGLVAAFLAQLARLSGARDVSAVIASTCRGLDDLRGIMGPLAKWLPASARLDDSLPFHEFSHRLGLSVSEASEEAEHFDPDPSAGEKSLIEPVGFEFDEAYGVIEKANLAWHIERRCTGPGACRLALSARRHKENTRLTLWYDPRRMGEGAVVQLAEQYVAFLRNITDRWLAPVGQVGLLGPSERARRLSEGKGAGRGEGAPLCLHRAFEAQAAKRPDAPALVCGEERLTYRELNWRANALARGLLRHGVGGGSPVGLCCERSADMIVGMLGILKAGGAYVPLDPHAPPQRLALQMGQAGFSVLVTQGRLKGRLPAGAAPALLVDAPDALEAGQGENLDVEPHPDDAASVVFTSGSTGLPKGVLVTHRGVANYTRAIGEALEFEPGLHFATVSTMSADLGNTSIFASLASGGCLHVIAYEAATDGRKFADYCRNNPVDVLKIVPSHLEALLDAGEGASALPRRWLVLGGEALPLGLAERVLALSKGCKVLNHYGPTETTVGALTMPLTAPVDLRGCASVPVGRPLANDEAYVLDGRLEPAPMGVPGELYLGGEGLSRGYLGQPGLTAERFVPHPFSAGARLYKTGDRARYRPDGSVEFLGRADQQVKIRGFRVEIGEIEARLREHPAVANAVAVAHREGPGGHRVVAYVVARDPALDEASLGAFLKERLPEYMLPGEVMWLKALPLTENGKVDRKALPGPEGHKRRDYVAPRTEVERTLAAIWASVLSVPRVGAEDDFFDLGGHSLLAIPLMHRVQQELGGALSLAAIFQARTVAALARLLEAERTPPAAVVLSAKGARPPLFCFDPTGRHVQAYQRLAESLDGDRPVFGLELGPALSREPESPSFLRIVEGLARAVREQAPRGPYFLAGWSTGGVLAFGVARALQGQGERVAFLGILDTQTRASLYAEGQPDIVDELAAYVDQRRSADLLALAPDELSALRERVRGLDDEARVTTAAEWAQARGFLPEGASASAFRARYALLRSAARFMGELPEGALDVPIHAWWSRETVARNDSPPVDWRRYTRAAVRTAVVSGDHLEAVQGGEAVALVREALRAVDAAG